MQVRVHNPSDNTLMFEGELAELLNVHASTITLHHAEKIVQGLYLIGRYVGTIGDVWVEITCFPVAHWLGGVNIARALYEAIEKADGQAKRTTDGPTQHVETTPKSSDDVHKVAKDEPDSEGKTTKALYEDDDIPF